MHNTEEGQDVALSYLKERGFRRDIIKKFQLGYNPEARDAFTSAAIGAQYSTELLVKSGLVNNRDDKFQDNYRGRIIFPIHNPTGKIAGFGARIIKKNDRAPKYINTPENEIYIKSKILYGSYFARMAIDKEDECLLVEGYTDVVSLHQAGVENVVASGGTSLTTDQLRLVKKYCDNLTIIYDGDNAGIKAALRGLDLALEERLNVKLVLIPDGEDPDSYVNKIGAEAFREFVNKNKKDFILFQLEIALREAGNDSAKKSAVVNQLAETIAKINRAEDFTRRQDYIRQVSEILKIEETGLNALVNKFLRDKITREETRNFNASTPVVPTPEITDSASEDGTELLFNRDEQNERALVRNLLEFGINPWSEGLTVAEYLFAEIDANELESHIESLQMSKILGMYKEWYREGLSPTEKNFLYLEDQEVRDQVIGLMHSDTELSANWATKYEGHIPTREELFKEEVFSSLNYLKLRKLKKMIHENQLEMQQAPSAEEQMSYVMTHQILKKLEIELTRQLGTVIYK